VVAAAAALCACASTAKPAPNSLQAPAAGESETPSPPPPPQPEPKAAPDDGNTAIPPASPPRTCDIFARPGVLKRAAVVRLLDAGLPRWLQGVEGDRALANHRFQGWLVKSMHPGDPCYQEVDLRAGDVVQKVNGKSIEKPDQAFDVAESLRTAPALVVDYLRDGKARKLTITITDQP
jgi:S1-C subfamily serine protease